MIRIGSKVKPFSARILRGGNLTQFSIPQSHTDQDGGYHKDGFINFLCKGDYSWKKGDIIKITKINGVSIRKANGNQYVGVVGEIEYIRQKDAELEKPDGSGSWDDDIPEELL